MNSSIFPFSFSLLLTGLLVSSCALGPTESTNVRINKDAIPDFSNKKESPDVLILETNSDFPDTLENTTVPSASQNSGLTFRTPDMTKSLPTSDQLTPLKRSKPVIDDSIEESTTIRPSQ